MKYEKTKYLSKCPVSYFTFSAKLLVNKNKEYLFIWFNIVYMIKYNSWVELLDPCVNHWRTNPETKYILVKDEDKVEPLRSKNDLTENWT